MVSPGLFSHGLTAISRTDIKELFWMVFTLTGFQLLLVYLKVPYLEPLLFLVYVNDLPSYINSRSSIALFADDSKLYKSIDLPDSTLHLQNDLDNVHKWSLDAMKFNDEVQRIKMSGTTDLEKKDEDCSRVLPGRPTSSIC